jgi:hypothetical protein
MCKRVNGLKADFNSSGIKTDDGGWPHHCN